MAKKVSKVVKLQVPGGKATPAPPVGPALGQAGVNIMAFVKDFNARTAQQVGLVIPVVITVYEDRSFTFICKTPPAAVLLKKAAGLEKASGEPNKNKVATLSRDKAREIAQMKMADLNASDLEARPAWSKARPAAWASSFPTKESRPCRLGGTPGVKPELSWEAEAVSTTGR